MSDHELSAPPPPYTPPPAVAAAAVPPKRRAKPGTDWWGEVKGIFWLVLAVLAFHSFVAKPFYIPSESMMPTLVKGDRLVVSKYAYGWSYVSPSIPNPVAIFRILVLHQPLESWAVELPFIRGRLLGRVPERGDVVIVKPPTHNTDYIKRVIGLPGDRLAVRGGTVILNGVPVKRDEESPAMIPMDPNVTCDSFDVPPMQVSGPDGKRYCQMRRVRETLPNGASFDTLDLLYRPDVDDFPEIVIPADHVFLMGDNRDQSADSRVPANENGLGGPVPIENLGGRAEFITFSLDGSSAWWNPLSWLTAMRGGRAGTSLRPQHVATPAAATTPAKAPR